MTTTSEPWLTIGQLARSGLAASALRFYEAQGLLLSERAPGKQRRFPRSTLRRVAFIRAAQRVGLSLADVRDSLAALPPGRPPSKRDWERLSKAWVPLLDARLAELQRLKTQLTRCIGCGCLSLQACGLSNPSDRAARRGPGARYLLPEP
jgi:MerR family redox-sensitive transcriptional activator SoxR